MSFSNYHKLLSMLLSLAKSSKSEDDEHSSKAFCTYHSKADATGRNTCSTALTPADFGSAELSGRDKVFLEVIWRKYRTLSAAGLREATHAEPPWLAARGNAKDGERSSAEITMESLRSFFGSQPEAALANPRELEDVYEGEAAAREQPPVPFDELRRRRRAATHPGKQPL